MNILTFREVGILYTKIYSPHEREFCVCKFGNHSKLYCDKDFKNIA